MRSKATEARVKAYECLSHIRKHDSFASEIIASRITTSKMSERDRAFATRLVMGVVSFKGTLDHVLNGCMNSPKDVKPDIRDVLRISTYEILYLRKDPHAAVSQGVELARYVNPKTSNLANAVLRKVVSASRSFPFGDPEKNMKAKSLLNGFPIWMTTLFYKDLGKDHADEMLSASDEPAPLYLVVNSLKAEIDAIETRLKQSRIETERVVIDGFEVEGCLKLSKREDLGTDAVQKLLSTGKAIVSDASAQLIANLAVDNVIESVGTVKGISHEISCLELCAGRGTKTVLLQSDLHHKLGTRFKNYVVADSFESKLALISDRAKACDLNIDGSICADLSKAAKELEGKRFDLVFLDAPCSCLGTFRRHPEVRWRVTDKNIIESGKLESLILANAAENVTDGGILVYSTCTITKRENEEVIASFLSSEDGRRFSLVPIKGNPTLRTYVSPGGSDAHFCAILKADNRII